MATVNSSSHEPDLYDARAQYFFSEYNSVLKQTRIETDFETLCDKLSLTPVNEHKPICIIGAGAAGLYTALILDSLNIPYDIYEASERVGGRIFTHQFGPLEGGSQTDAAKYEYFDAGAMRFHKSPFMKRLTDLVERLGSLTEIPYVFADEHQATFLSYNGISITRKDESLGIDPDPFKVRQALIQPSNQPQTELEWLLVPSSAQRWLTEVALEEPRSLFKKDVPIREAIRQLFEKYDCYTMRSWLTSRVFPPMTKPLTFPQIAWLETVNGSSGTFDEAFTEVVLSASLPHDWPGEETTEWYCFDGGSSQLPLAMEQKIKSEVKKNHSVTLIRENKSTSQSPSSMTVVTNNDNCKEYAAVLCTLPFGCLSAMDLTGCSIMTENYSQWSSIRELKYTPAIKIGMRFKSSWWEERLGIIGGQSFSDLPLRRIAYPSYPKGHSKSNCLIASYCLLTDSLRLSSLVENPKTGTASATLIRLVMRDLAIIHNLDVKDIEEYYDDNGENCFVWDWNQDPFTMGGFAFYGPTQFFHQHQAMMQPAANGKLFFSGEALSSAHGWVVGALESAWNCVSTFLQSHQLKDEDDKLLHDKFLQQWPDLSNILGLKDEFVKLSFGSEKDIDRTAPDVSKCVMS